MAKHIVQIFTTDKSTTGSLSPTSVDAAGGDQISFVSKHKGRDVSSAVQVNIESGEVCNSPDSNIAIPTVSVPKNSSVAVFVSQNTSSPRISFSVGSDIGFSGELQQASSPRPVTDDD